MKLERLGGILVHPTSFPSHYGIGDLGSGAYNFVDFLHKSNLTLWQVLPLNPTSFGDSPYQSFSTFAGNSMLISPEILLQEGYISEEDLIISDSFSDKKIDYGKVINYKNSIFRKAFNNFKLKANENQKKNFKDFCKRQESWLEDYTLFVSLKSYFIKQRKENFDKKEYEHFIIKNEHLISKNLIDDFFYGAVFNSWPEDIVKRKDSEMKKFKELLKDEIEYEKFLQYEFFRQWKNLKEYANNKNIKIIGDIPIFVAMDSCDVWVNKDLFYLTKEGYPTVVAGVPPDDFSDTGQLWGNPLYNWDANKKEKYNWWILRFASMLDLVDIIRIDHFRGFESYFEIKYGEPNAKIGKWKKGPGKEIFEAIEKKLGKLPIIAEDLGFMTQEVIDLRDAFNFPGMKILQFAFDGDNKNDFMPHNIKTSNCIIYTGTHDNDTSVGWYEKANEKEKDIFRRYMNVSGEDPAWDLIRLAFSSVADYAIIPIQDFMGLNSEYRMNTPGTTSGNWQFRYTDEMLADDLVEKIKYLKDLYNR